MPRVTGLMLGAFAAFIVWTLVRALRDGIIFSDGVGYDLGKEPVKFVSTALVHGSGALLFAWLALHGRAADIYRLVLQH